MTSFLSEKRFVLRLTCLFILASMSTFAFSQGTATQSIQMLPIADQTYGVAPFQVIALASSNLPVTLTVQGPATLNQRLLTITGTGSVTVKATQGGNADYAPATAQETFNVHPGIPSIQWNPGTIVYGTPLNSNVLNASATAIPAADPSADAAVVTYQFDTSQLTGGTQPTVPATSQAFRYEGTPVVTASNGGVSVDRSIDQYHSYLVSFTCDCLQFEFVVQSVQGSYRIGIDGAWTSPDVINDNHFPHTAYYKLVFPSKRVRQIRLIFGGNPLFYGAITVGDDSISPPQTPIGGKFVSFGDSWAGPTVTQPLLPPPQSGSSGFGELAGEFFNWDWWESGLGGSGFINTTYPTQENFVKREQSDLCNTHPEYVLIFGGINDAAQSPAQVEAAVTQFFATLTSCLPNAAIFYLGPQAHTPVEASDAAGAEKFSNIIFYEDIAPENWIYGSSTDPSSGNAYLYLNAHPTVLGYDFLAEKIITYILNKRPDLLPKPYPLFSPAPAEGSFNYSAAANSLLPAGSHQLSATFTPKDTADYATVTQSVMLTVTKASTSLSLFASASSAAPGTAVTLSSKVSPQIAGIPTGSVSFLDNGTAIGSSPIDASGTASFNINTLSSGPHSISASYAGDGNFLPSTSSAPTQVLIVKPDFTFTIDQQQVTVLPGQASTINLSIVPLSGLSTNLNLSCSGLPPGAVCKPASGSQIPVQQHNATVPVLIQAYTSRTALNAIPGRSGGALSGAELCGVLGFFMVLRHKGRRHFASVTGVAFLLITGSFILSGCGSSTKIDTAQPGTYTVQVVLTDAANASTTHSQVITVTIP